MKTAASFGWFEKKPLNIKKNKKQRITPIGIKNHATDVQRTIERIPNNIKKKLRKRMQNPLLA